MKLRLHGNSVRLRLNRREVAEFAATGVVTEQILFPGASLVYTLERGGDALTAAFSTEGVHISVPAAMANSWAESDDVGIYGSVGLAGGGQLGVLIEKDFQCLHHDADPDAYPNPQLR